MARLLTRLEYAELILEIQEQMADELFARRAGLNVTRDEGPAPPLRMPALRYPLSQMKGGEDNGPPTTPSRLEPN